MGKTRHPLVRADGFSRTHIVFNGKMTPSVIHEGEHYIELKRSVSSVGLFSKISQVSRKIEQGDAISIYEKGIKTTFIKLKSISGFLQSMRGKGKILRGIDADTGRNKIKRERQLETKYLTAKEIGRLRAIANCKERSLSRRVGIKLKGEKFRYVKRITLTKDEVAMSRDCMPARFEGNINLAA